MISFSCRGHPNITCSHKTTLEFTKESDVTPDGHCIIGVGADFDLLKLKKMAASAKTAKMTLMVSDITDDVIFTFYPKFLDSKEIVIRKSNFESKRTLGILANKASSDLDPVLKEYLKDPDTMMKVRIEPWRDGN